VFAANWDNAGPVFVRRLSPDGSQVANYGGPIGEPRRGPRRRHGQVFGHPRRCARGLRVGLGPGRVLAILPDQRVVTVFGPTPNLPVDGLLFDNDGRLLLSGTGQIYASTGGPPQLLSVGRAEAIDGQNRLYGSVFEGGVVRIEIRSPRRDPAQPPFRSVHGPAQRPRERLRAVPLPCRRARRSVGDGPVCAVRPHLVSHRPLGEPGRHRHGVWPDRHDPVRPGRGAVGDGIQRTAHHPRRTGSGTRSPCASRTGAAATDTQSFTIDVSGNLPPKIISTPPTIALAGQTYAYDVDAVDPNNDPPLLLAYERARRMAIDPATGQITWPVPPSDPQFGFAFKIGAGGNDGATRRRSRSTARATPT